MTDIGSTSFLKTTKVFDGLDDGELKFIETYGEVRRYDLNEIIVSEGQKGHPLFILMKGRVEVVLPKYRDERQMSRPTYVRLGRLSAGDCIGEYSLIDKQPASASVIAIEPCDVFVVPRDGFEEIIHSGDHMARVIFENMLKIMIARARQRNKELDLCY